MFIGQANHLAWNPRMAWLNKMSYFFVTDLREDGQEPTDDEGELVWISVSELLRAPVEEYWFPGTAIRIRSLKQPVFAAHQRWAVERALYLV
jgi:hypothetical protein